jgi:hypothetical protein
MKITEDLLQLLLYEEESNVLDFKRDQYRFINSSPFEKLELLKDILAFCNAWRKTDAFILIGIEEAKGSESKVIGITEVLDDAQIQQFVNGKTQRPVNFSYRNLSFRNKQIALIHIPVQERPIYLKKDYERLKRNVVYVRRGSSTSEAMPDEIADMRSSNTSPSSHIIPKLSLRFKIKENDYTDCLKVPSYKILNKSDLLSKLNNLKITEEDFLIVQKHKVVLDDIEDRYPDGNTFYPYKVNIVEGFRKKILDATEMVETDFEKLCGLIELSSRSFELAKSFYAKLREKKYLYPVHTLLNISNTGKCPAENIILYIMDNEKVKLLNLERLRDLSIILYDQIPEHVTKIIEKVKEIEKGINKPIVTMYEKVKGTKCSSLFGSPNLNRRLFHDSRTPILKLVNGKIKITLEIDLMHNHDIVIPANDIYLCPLLKKDEKADISYMFHAKNLPDPQEGKLVIKGVEF